MARELSRADQKALKKNLDEKCNQAYTDVLKKCTKIVDSWKTKPPKNPVSAFANLYLMLDSEDSRLDRIAFYEYDYTKLTRIVATGLLTEGEMTGLSEKGRLRIMKDAEAFRQKYLNRAAKSEMDLAV
ncbi:hypothetical protein [Pedobacter heparinus]|uniref:hypothetical protein n=1 Tax=Pedobacter heparinus TaxID=984 RepID=UPI0029310951|nr:hypothetical protein [Pedobacter heparinus]